MWSNYQYNLIDKDDILLNEKPFSLVEIKSIKNYSHVLSTKKCPPVKKSFNFCICDITKIDDMTMDSLCILNFSEKADSLSSK